MADLQSSVAAAKRAGYSDAEIAAYLSKDPSLAPKISTARKAGYSDAEIIGHLGVKRVGLIEGVARSARQGFTFGTDDELRGQKAMRPTFGEAVTALRGGKTRTFAERKADAARTVADERASQNAFAKEHPFLDFAGQVAGGMANPLSWAGGGIVGGAKSFGGAVLRNAGVGAVTGAAYGAGNATEGNRIAGAATGGVVGGALGATLPVAVKGVQKALGAADRALGSAPSRAIRSGLERVGVRVPAARTAEDIAQSQADDYIASLARQGKTDAAGVSAFAAQHADDPSMIGAEALGERGVQGLGALARRPGTTADAAANIAEARQAAMPDNLLGAFEGVGVKPEAAQGMIDDIVKSGREAAAPLYKAAFNRELIQSNELTKLMNAPSIKRALPDAATMMADDGLDPLALGIEFASDGSTKYIRTPSMEALDYVKRALQGQIERDALGRPLRSDKNAILGGLVGRFTDELKRINPDYAKALATAGDYKSAEAAYKMGDKFLSTQGVFKDPRTIKAWVAKAGAADIEAAKGGVANDLYLRAVNGKLKPGALKSPAVQAKLSALYGDEAADEITRIVGREIKKAATNAVIQPRKGSPTAGYGAEFAAQDGTPTTPGPISTVIDAISSPLVTARKLGGYAESRLRTRGMNAMARDIAGEVLLSKPNALAAALARQATPRVPPGVYVGETDVTGPISRNALRFVPVASGVSAGGAVRVNQR